MLVMFEKLQYRIYPLNSYVYLYYIFQTINALVHFLLFFVYFYYVFVYSDAFTYNYGRLSSKIHVSTCKNVS